MNDRIFLRKYRVFAAQIEVVGGGGGKPLAYEGVEAESGRKVLVEVLPAAGLTTVVREQLEAEAIAAMKLSHVNIPTLSDFGVEGDDLVYVTDALDGSLAEEWVGTYGPMPVAPVLRIATQVVSALGAAAFHKILHQAINPGNIMLMPGQTAEGEWPLVKVLHFVGHTPPPVKDDGSAAAFNKASAYTSPEQLLNGAIDFRSEIYSLGCTMWFLLTGTPPPMPSKEPTATQPATIELAIDKLGGLPKDVGRLLAQMLSENPDARPRDLLAFYRQLQDCLTQLAGRGTGARGSAGSDSSPARAASQLWLRHIPIRALSAAALLLAITAITVLVLPGYLRHRQAVHAAKPIGVPVGVLNAFASATPATAVAQSNSKQSLPAKSVEPAPARPAGPDSSRIVSASQVEVPTAPKETRRLPEAKVSPIPAMTRHEVRRAQPAEADVRRSGPPSPAEGPTEVVPRTTALADQQTNSASQADWRSNAMAKTTPRPSKRREPQSKPSPTPRTREPGRTNLPPQPLPERRTNLTAPP